MAGLNRRKPVGIPCAQSHILHGREWQRCRMQDPAGQSGGRPAGIRKQSRHFARKDRATPFRRRSVSVLTGPEIQGLFADELPLHPAPLCGSHPDRPGPQAPDSARTARCLIKKLAIGANAPENQSLAGATSRHRSVRPTPSLFRRETAQGGPADRTTPIYANATKLNGTCDYTPRRSICVLPAHSVLSAIRPSKRTG